MDFWLRLDDLLARNRIVIDRPKGSAHPRYPELVYPLDYGHVTGTRGGDGAELDVWRGSLGTDELVAAVCTVDSVKGDVELKLLLGCTEAGRAVVGAFHDSTAGMSGRLLVRGAAGR